MEERIVDTVDTIIKLIENDEFKVYKYDNKKFHIIDKEKNIDFQAKLANNNYYFRDNINNLTYIKTRKFLGRDFTVQQILVEDGTEKCYYSFLERDYQTSLISVVSTDEDMSLTCTNTEVVDHDWKDIMAYAKEIFEDIKDYSDEDEEGLAEEDLDEDELAEEEFDNDELNDEELDDDDESNAEKMNLEEFYERYNLFINKKEIDGKAKINIVPDLEIATFKRYANSILLDETVGNLKIVIESKLKKQELQELEK
ncbi:MAG: hypothetical protein IKN65_02170 [Clostridia bacterium]|nr:hypothetical protein [Clostridia bacterium]